MDYQGLMSYLLMPVYALMTWILFLDIKKLNYTEHLIANAYTTAQVSFLQVLICLPLFGFLDINYQNFNWFFLLLSTIYQFFVFRRIHQIGLGSTILRALGYLIMFFIVFMGIGLIILFIGIMTGTMSLEDFRPK